MLVLAIAVVDTVDEAVELANDSEYSLVSSLWTTNVHKAFEVGSRIRAGEITPNQSFDSIYIYHVAFFSSFLRVRQYQWDHHELGSWRGSSRSGVRRPVPPSARST